MRAHAHTHTQNLRLKEIPEVREKAKTKETKIKELTWGKEARDHRRGSGTTA